MLGQIGEPLLMSTKHIQEVKELVEEYGFKRVEHRKSGHLCLRHPNPDVHLVFAPTTPSDPRWKEVLVSKMRKALVEAGLTDKLGPMKNAKSTENEEKPSRDNSLSCDHCDREFDDARGVRAHEEACEKNPDRYKTCPSCGRPCVGRLGLARHLASCQDEDKDGEETDIEPEEKTNEPVPARETTRILLGDLLSEYERIRQSTDGNLYLASSELNATLDMYADLIVEEFS